MGLNHLLDASWFITNVGRLGFSYVLFTHNEILICEVEIQRDVWQTKLFLVLQIILLE